MDKLIEIINTGGIIDMLPATLSTLLVGYVVLKALDFFTGILKSWKLRNYRSAKMREGIIKFVAELVCLTFTMVMDIILGLNFLTYMTAALFVYKEAGSLIENLGELGVPIVKVLKDRIEVLNGGDREWNSTKYF